MGTKIKITEDQLKRLVANQQIIENKEKVVEVEKTEEVKQINEAVEKIKSDFKRFK